MEDDLQNVYVKGGLTLHDSLKEMEKRILWEYYMLRIASGSICFPCMRERTPVTALVRSTLYSDTFKID